MKIELRTETISLETLIGSQFYKVNLYYFMTIKTFDVSKNINTFEDFEFATLFFQGM